MSPAARGSPPSSAASANDRSVGLAADLVLELGLQAEGLRHMARHGQAPVVSPELIGPDFTPVSRRALARAEVCGHGRPKQLSNAGESNVRSISGGRKPPQAQSDHCEGHSEGQNGARGSSPGLVSASVSWCSGWSCGIWPGRGMPEGFMACKRSGVRIPIAPPQLESINSNTEPMDSGASEGQIEGQSQSVTRCLACGDVRAGSCGPQVMALLAARRSGVRRRVVGRLSCPARGEMAAGACDRADARAAVWRPEGGGRAAGVAISGVLMAVPVRPGARRLRRPAAQALRLDGALAQAQCMVQAPDGGWLLLGRPLLCAVRGSGSGHSACNMPG